MRVVGCQRLSRRPDLLRVQSDRRTRMNRLAVAALLLAFATPALAGDFNYQAGFNYQPQQQGRRFSTPSYSAPSYGHGEYYRPRRLPGREVTTITPTDDGGTRIETRRFYDTGNRASVNTRSGAWSRNSPYAK